MSENEKNNDDLNNKSDLDAFDKEANKMMDETEEIIKSDTPFKCELLDEEAISEIEKINEVEEKAAPMIQQFKRLNKKISLLWKERDLYKDKFFDRLEELYEDNFVPGKLYRIRKRKDGIRELQELDINKETNIAIFKEELDELVQNAYDINPEDFQVRFHETMRKIIEENNKFNMKQQENHEEDDMYLW